jgi:hypothetical protein
MTELVTQDRAPEAEARQGPHGGRRCRDREFAGDPSRHDAAERGAEAIIEQHADGRYDNKCGEPPLDAEA